MNTSTFRLKVTTADPATHERTMKQNDLLDSILREILPATYNSAPKRRARAIQLLRSFLDEATIEDRFAFITHGWMDEPQLAEFRRLLRSASDRARRTARAVAGRARVATSTRDALGRMMKKSQKKFLVAKSRAKARTASS